MTHQKAALRKPGDRHGLILLVVLGMLAFLSLLVVTYVAFSSSARRIADSQARAEFRAPDVNELFENAMLKLVRGTNDPNDPLFGEDLLSDFYGRKGSLTVRVMPPLRLNNGTATLLPSRRPVHLGGGFVRIPIDFQHHYSGPPGPARPLETRLDDYYTGRVITFLDGPLENRSFRVLRSVGIRAANTPPYQNVDSFLIELDPEEFVTLGNGVRVQIASLLGNNPHDISALFYAPGGTTEWGAPGHNDDSAEGPGNSIEGNLAEAGYPVNNGTNLSDDVPYELRINPAPLNAPGLGVSFSGTTANWVANGRDDDSDGVADEVGETASNGVDENNDGTADDAGELAFTIEGTKAPPIVFLPNTFDGTTTINKSGAQGDFDEEYDAPDYNNWFLAGRVRVPDGSGGFVDRIIPSFHRPSVINYLVNLVNWRDTPNPQALPEILEAYRRATFRPLPFPFSNPQFSGGSTDYALSTPIPFSVLDTMNSSVRLTQVARLELLTDALINGTTQIAGNRQWDVDNDGDGVPDSVWIDIGLPLLTSPEGKLLRPLVAVMIEDTSGKLNVNTHGAYPQTNQARYWNNRTGPFAGNYVSTGQELFRGLGYGPAEIGLCPSDPFNTGTAIQNTAIQQAEFFELIRQRYAWSDRREPNFPAPGDNSNDSIDRLFNVKPSTHDSFAAALHISGGNAIGDGYGQSLDPHGYGGVGIDRFGHTFVTGSGQVLVNFNNSTTPIQPLLDESINDTYEFDPTRDLHGDSAYTLAELEAVLRSSDWDIDNLPQRLRERLSSSLVANPRLAQMLTTVSSSMDLPPSVPLPGNRSGAPQNLVRVIGNRLNLGIPASPTAADIVRANDIYVAVVAPELRLGRKLDVNRALGNGIDDNNNGVVDDPAEFGDFADNDGNGWTDEIAEFRLALRPGHDGVDNDGDGNIDENDERPPNSNYLAFPMSSAADGTQAIFGSTVGEYAFGATENDVSGSGRELLARHLFVLAMALKSQGYELPLLENSGGDTEVNNPADYTAHRLAQWAINVVDFRDPDSIMTRFVYDPNPLDGWDVVQMDGSQNPAARVVWGCESPEISFTEGFALHDIRVRDTTHDPSGRQKGDPNNPDPGDESGTADTDSVRIPQGSLFLELYCNRQIPIYPSGPVGESEADKLARQSAFRAAFHGVPRELYSIIDTDSSATVTQLEAFLDMARLSNRDVPAPGQTVAAPVWRIALSSAHYVDSPLESANPATLRRSHPNSYSFDPEHPFEVQPQNNPITADLTYDRFILFGNYANFTALQNVASAMSGPAGPAINGRQIFFIPTSANTNAALVRPGGYMVLAPRTTTYFGSERYTDDADPMLARPTGHSNQRIELVSSPAPLASEDMCRSVRINNASGDFDASTIVTPSQAFRVKTFAPSGWSNGVFEDNMVGLNVSEPLPRSAAGYYTEPTERLDSMNGTFTLNDAYLDYEDTASTSARDQPEDMRIGNSPIRQLTVQRRGVGATDPFLGTEEQFCSAFLQRLADPLRPFDQNLNPYITVDWMPIDLTVFSGESDPNPIDLAGFANDSYATRSRQRNGEDSLGRASQSVFSLETRDSNPTPGVLATGGTNYFEFDTAQVPTGSFSATLGYLNHEMFGATIGFAAANAATPVAMGLDRGQPQTPFAMLDWLNRPYASHYELMLVPASSPSRFYEEFSVTPCCRLLPTQWNSNRRFEGC